MAQLIERSLGSPSAVALSSKKSQLIELAKQEGIAVPATAVVANLLALRKLIAHQCFPMVLKLDRATAATASGLCMTRPRPNSPSASWRATAGRVAAIKHSIQRRDIACLEGLYRALPAISLQEFIDGVPANCAVACHRGRVLAGLSVEAVRTNGATGPATVIRIIEFGRHEQGRRKAGAAAWPVGFRGA